MQPVIATMSISLELVPLAARAASLVTHVRYAVKR
jgi:hypothetical protein